MKDILLTFLSGALGGVVFQEALSFIKMKRNYCREQIDNLYGPMYFCIIRARANFEHSNAIQKAYQEYFEPANKFSQNPSTQNNLRNMAKQTLNVSNAYANAGISINEEIFEIISSNYSYVDSNDMEIFKEFVENYERIKIELNENMKLDLEIYRKLGDGNIHGLQDSFCKRIEEQFLQKKGSLVASLFRETFQGFKIWLRKFRF